MRFLRSAMLATLLAAVLQTGTAHPLPEPPPCFQVTQPNTDTAATEAQIRALRSASFPELANTDLRVRTFHSDADYFRTRFSLTRFFLPVRMRYFVDVNPNLFGQQPPTDGVCSVLAHELSHVVALSHGNRIRRLGLVRLVSSRYTAKFERRTDLEAIHRGYGDGLKDYRSWVYVHIPAKILVAKHRNYFSPEEISAIQVRLRAQAEMFSYWSKHVPLNLAEVQAVRP